MLKDIASNIKAQISSNVLNQETMTENETATLKTACEAYTEVLQAFSQKLYANAAPEGGDPGDYGPDHNHGGPDVFDGDFTEN